MIFLDAVIGFCVTSWVIATVFSVINAFGLRRAFYERVSLMAHILRLSNNNEPRRAGTAWGRHHGNTWREFKARDGVARREWRKRRSKMAGLSEKWLAAYHQVVLRTSSERGARMIIESFGWNEFMKGIVLLSDTQKRREFGPRFVDNCACPYCRPARRLSTDSFGTLWSLYIGMGREISVVEVENSTKTHPEHYFIPVARDLRPLGPEGAFGSAQDLTARNAIASTFGMRGEQYHPDKAA